MRPTGVTRKKGSRLVVTGAEWGSAIATGGAQIVISGSSIAENASVGALVGILSVANGSGVYVFAMTDSAGGKFALDVAQVEVNGALDYEAASAHNVTVTANNGVSPILTKVIRINVLDVFETPPSIVLTGSTIAENASIGDLVGTLSVINGTGTYSFTMIDTAGGKFALDGVNDTLVEVAAALDYETATSHDIEIEADNGVYAAFSQPFTITVTDVGEGGGGSAGQPIGLLLAITKAA